MKKIIGYAFATVMLIAIGFYSYTKISSERNERTEDKYMPGEWFHFQRAYPNADIPYQKYVAAVTQKNLMQRQASGKAASVGVWSAVGPANIGGRITALAVHPANPNIIWAGAAAGGIWKTTDGGTTWQPKTDNFSSLSVGALQLDPNNPNILYCGTGEANTSIDSYAGIGILKSTDAGETWFPSGLDSSQHIAEIKIHPLNSNLIYAAVAGGLYSTNSYRGIYKSTNAGATWTRSLYVTDSTSATDVSLDPTDPNRVYAAMWERLRGVSFRRAAGVSGGIFVTTNGGTNWTRLSNGLPTQTATQGRIGVAVAPSNANLVYAVYRQASSANGSDNNFGGFYKSTDKGTSWTRMPDGNLSSSFSNFGWYFGIIKVSPTNANEVYIGDIDVFRSTDGGTSWTNITNGYSGTFDQQHPDQHALHVGTNFLVNGNDGGVFTSVNGGSSWSKKYNLPITQFYAAAIDYHQPQRKFGGYQDNGTWGTFMGGSSDWQDLYDGDGFYCLVDYTNSNVIYAESQSGGIGRSDNGGSSFIYIGSGIDFLRTNWSTPYIMDLQDPNRLFLGTYKLHTTTNKGASWTAISPDLTRGGASSFNSSITAISSAVVNSQRVLYVGTGDARVSVSTNTGTTWTDVSAGLPNRYVTDVLCDKRNPAVAYATLSGYNQDLTNPHVFRTSNYGATWQNISSNLPDVPTNSIIIDYDQTATLYVGTDAGVFYTTDLGTSWSVVGTGLPNSPVSDLVYHQPTKKLFAATHGRSMFAFDLTTLAAPKETTKKPTGFQLMQNYPNPFNPTTVISYQLSASSWVTLKVYDVLGREVATLVSEKKAAGNYNVRFDASSLSSGTYFYKFQAKAANGAENDFTETKKMIVLK